MNKQLNNCNFDNKNQIQVDKNVTNFNVFNKIVIRKINLAF